MRWLCTILLAFVVGFSASADERGEEMLQRIGRRYTALGSYRLTFTLTLSDGSTSGGELAVSGNNLYMKMVENEIFVEDSVRYEVHPRQREIIIDRADAYDKEIFNPLKGVDGLGESYNIDFVEAERALRLVPKSGGGDTLYIYIGVDGESIERIKMGEGKESITIAVGELRYTQQQPLRFDRAKYKEFELIDFR